MVQARIREVEVLKERAKGKSYAKIGEAIGISGNSARKALLRALETLKTERDEVVTEYVGLQLERMRIALEAIMGRVEEGELEAIETMLKIEARTARLLALDAPTKWPEDEYGRPTAPGMVFNVAKSFDGLSEAQLEGLRLLGMADVATVTSITGGEDERHDGSTDSRGGRQGAGEEEPLALYEEDEGWLSGGQDTLADSADLDASGGWSAGSSGDSDAAETWEE